MSQRTWNIHSKTAALGLVCINLALVPSAFAQTAPIPMLPPTPPFPGTPAPVTPTPAPAPISTNVSNTSGFSNASGIAAQSLIGRSILGNVDGSQPYSQQVISAAQAIQSDLSTAAANYSAALAALNQAQAGATATAPAPAVDNTQRFSVRGATASADCGCKNPDAPIATTPSTSGAELASAQAAEAKAAAELVRAQQAARQFLAANKKDTQISANATQFSPIW